MKLELIRKYDLEKLVLSYWSLAITLFIYVLISGNHLHIVVTNPKLIEICNFIDNHYVLSLFISLITYFTSYIFVCFSIIRQRINKLDIFKISGLIIIVWIIKCILEPYNLANYFDIIIFIGLYFVYKPKIPRIIIGFLLTFGYTLINSIIKDLCIMSIDFNTMSSLEALIFSIDVYVMYFTVYLTMVYRKENKHGKMVTVLQIRQKVENYFCSSGNSSSSCVNNNRNSSSVDYFNLYCGIIFTTITYLSLLIIGIIFNRWIEMTISVIYFHIFRGKESNTYHSKTNDIKCWCVSMINFAIVMKLTLPIYISYLLSILVSFILCVAMRICYYITEKLKYSKMDRRQKILSIVPNNEDKIEKICNKECLKDMSEVIYIFLNNTIEDTSAILNIPVRTINNKINKFIKHFEDA